jgi:hypothetical protein
MRGGGGVSRFLTPVPSRLLPIWTGSRIMATFAAIVFICVAFAALGGVVAGLGRL